MADPLQPDFPPGTVEAEPEFPPGTTDVPQATPPLVVDQPTVEVLSPGDQTIHLGPPGEVSVTEPNKVTLTQDESEKAGRIKSIFNQAWVSDADRDVAMQRFAREANLKFDVVRNNFDELKHSWEAVRFDSVKWMKDYPKLARLVLDHPELAATVERDQQLSYLHQALDWVKDRDGFGFLLDHPELQNATPAELREAFAADIARRHQPKKQVFTKDAESEELKDGWSVFGGGLAVPNRAIVPFKRFGEMWDQMNLSKAQYELMMRTDLGKDTYELENRINDMKLDMHRRDYNEGPVEQIFTDAFEAASSSVNPMLTEAAPLAAAGAVTVGAGTLLATKSPALAGKAALEAGAFFGKAGTIYGTFQLESGSAYGDMIADGLDHRHASVAAKIYGTLASGIEFASWGPMFKALGPVGALAKEGSVEAFTKELLKSQGFMKVLKNLALEGVAEGGEEFLQDATQQAVEYFAKAHQTGSYNQNAVDFGPSIEAGVKGTTGGIGLGIAHSGINMTTRALFQGRAQESRDIVTLLANFESATKDMDPEAIAENLQHMGGVPKSLHMDTAGALKLFQEAKVDPSQAAVELLGQGGDTKLQEAIATGQKLEIPLKNFLDWKSKLKPALADHLTTDASLPTPAAIDEKAVNEAAKALAKQFEEGGEDSEPQSLGEVEWLEAMEKSLATVPNEDAQTAREKMQLERAVLRTWASRFGQDASDLFRDAKAIVEEGTNATAREVLMARAENEDFRTTGRADELYRDEATGLPNRAAFNATPVPHGQAVGLVGFEGAKWLNDNGDHKQTDLVMLAVARALEQQGIKPHRVNVGDFAFHVKDQGDVQAAIELAREALPEELRGFALTGAVGPDLNSAAYVLDAHHDKLIGEGQRANPRPVLLDADGVPILDGEGNEQVQKPQRPKGLPEGAAPATLAEKVKGIAKATPELAEALRKRAEGLSSIDYFNEAYVDPETGCWTKKGWDALPRRKHVASLDLSGLRRANKKFGKVAGDKLLYLIKKIAQDVGGESVDFTQFHGDEFGAQSDDPKMVAGFVEHLRAVLDTLAVPAMESETGELHLIPIEFHNGYSNDYSLEKADADLNERKERLKRAKGSRSLELRRDQRSGSEDHQGRGVGGSTEGDSSSDSAASADASAEEVAKLPFVTRTPSTPETRAASRERAKQYIARAGPNKTMAQAWYRWCVELRGNGERPKVSWHVESTLARFDVIDPINGFSGDELGRDMAKRKMKGDKRRGGDADARKARRAGQGLTGSAADAQAKAKSEPMSRNIFKQEPGPTTLLYQFPTPEESVARMQEEQVLRDSLLERGAQPVADSEALINVMRGEAEVLRPRPGDLAFVVTFRVPESQRIRAHVGLRQFDSIAHAEAFIREAGSTALSAEVVTGRGTSGIHRARIENRAQREELGIGPTETSELSGLQSESDAYDTGYSEARKGDGHLHLGDVEASPEGYAYRRGWNDAVDGRPSALDDVPASKNLPGQAGLERATAAGLGTMLGAAVVVPEGYTGAVVLEQSKKEEDDWLDRIIAHQDAVSKAVNDRVAELDAEDKALYEFRDKNGGGPIVVSKDPSKPGKWRITWFDKDGEPIGHSEAATREAAIKRAPEYGADIGAKVPPAPVRLDQGKKVTATEPFKKWFGDSKVVDDAGQPKVVFHGSQRPDRIGDRFQKSRATSGPSAFFTDDPEIASSYSTNKNDTSIDIPTDYSGWFRMKVGKSTVDLDKAWGLLTPEQREEIRAKLPHVVHPGEDRSQYALDANDFGLAGESHWAHEIRAAHGNVLKAAKEIWLNGGELVDSEDEFMQVLDLGGAKGLFEFHDPHATSSGVIPVYLSIKNPLVTSKITADDVAALESASRRQREPSHGRGVDQWDKRSQSPSGWIQRLKEDLESGSSSHAWTSIPDWVTRTLRSRGYDGIHDVGGKNGGSEHSVWIPFEPTQIKSATGNRGTFDPNSPSILRAEGKQPGEQPRGYTEIYNDGLKRLYKVVLNPNADHSTFLHESAHVFFDLMINLAQRPDAPAQVKEDFDIVLKWLGAAAPEDLVVKSNAHDDPARLKHEKWARGFERYLLEGKAPSKRLVPMFERFRLWLSRIYKSVSQLNVDINDDIRGVFDRMLATDKEIESFKKTMGLSKPPMAREVFDNEKDYEAYLKSREELTNSVTRRIDLAAARDKLREQERWWKEEMKKEEQNASEEYEKLPERVAQQTLAGKGDLAPRGESQGPIRLAREDVVAAVGEKLAKKFLTTTKDSEKVDPNEVADYTGFGDAGGQKMLEAILALPQKDKWVKARAAEVMGDKHPDVVDSRVKLREQVSKGLHGEATEAALLHELAALKLKSARPGMRIWDAHERPVEVIRRAAKDIASRATVDRLDAGRALRAQLTESDLVAKSILKKDFHGAFLHKQKQLLNFYLWRELSQAREERDGFLELASRVSKDIDGGSKGKSSALGKASPIYRDGARNLLEVIGLRPVNEDEPAATVEDVVAQMEKDGQVIAIDEDVLSKIEMKPRGWKEFTVAEMRTVRDALQNILAAARGKNTVLRGEKRLDFEEQVERLLDEGGRNLPPIAPSPEKGAEFLPQLIGGTWQWVDGWMVTPETMLLHWLGQNDIHSEAFQCFVLPMQQAKHREVEVLRGPVRRIVEAYDKMPSSLASRMREKVNGKELFPSHTDLVLPPQTHFQILMMLLNMGNQSNADRLTQGRGITEQQVMDAAVKIGITKEEWDWVQSVWDACEDLKKPAFDLEEKMTGVRPEEIHARPIKTPFGTYKGGYFPAAYDKRGSSGVGEKQLLAQLMDPHYVPAGTSRSHLKKRADEFADVISLTPQTIYRHLAAVAHDIAFREAVHSVARLLDDDRIAKMLRDRLGDKRAERLGEWVKDVGRGRGGEGSAQVNPFAAGMGLLRGSMAVSVLGGSLQNAAEDLVTGLTMAVPGSELKPGHLAAGVAAVKGGLGRQAIVDAHARSGELRSRREQLSRELLTNIAKLIARTPFGRGPLRAIKDHAFIVQEETDKVVSSALWIAAHRQAVAEGMEAGDEKGKGANGQTADAVVFADKLIRGLLPSHHVVDSSAMMRNENVAALLVFFRFWNTLYNVGRRHGPGFFSNVATPKRAAQAMGVALAVGILGSVARGQGPDPGEPWDKWFIRKLVSGQLGKYPFMGEMFDLGWSLSAGSGQKREPRNNTVTGMLASIYLLMERALDGDKDADDRLEAAIKAWSLLPVVGGQPVGQPLKSGMYGYRMATGKRVPREALYGIPDMMGGFFYGQGAQQPANPFTILQDLAEGVPPSTGPQ